MFYTDTPISSSKDDLLNRNGFAKLLAQSLINLNSTDTFTVGLFGKWGSGKTSLVNMTLQEIKNCHATIKGKNTIIVHFEPWNFSDTNQLLTQFFLRLSNEFRSKGDKTLAQIGDALEKYSDAFEIATAVPVVGGLLALLGKKGASTLSAKMKKGSDEKDILKQKEYVVNLLDEQKNKVLVVIDDIDRLSNEQIRQVFQLITSVARFPNMTYLLVFDKDIVIRALEKVQEGSGEDYLEKIIQMPIQIPDLQRAELRQAFFDRLDKIIKENEKINFSTEHWQKVFEPCIDPFIKTLRDVSRLCNVIQFKLTTIASEVDFADMVAISTIEIYLSAIYEWIKTNKHIMIGSFDVSSIGFRNKSQHEWCKDYEDQFSKLLQHEKSNSVRDVNAETISLLLSHLFPSFGHKIGKIYEPYDLNQLRKNNQIAHPEKFDRYFHLDLDRIGLKKAELLAAVQKLDCDALKTLLFEFDQNGTSYEFIEEIKAIIPELSPDRAKVLAIAFLESSNQLDAVSSHGLISLSASRQAEYTILELIDRIPSVERMCFIVNFLNSTAKSSLEVLANVINMIELGYGRLAASGKEHGYKKVITLEELIQLETKFCENIKRTLESTCLFDFNEWRMICHLLESFDADYADVYLNDALKNDKNILRYLDNSVGVWTGAGIEYEVNNEYKDRLTTRRVLDAIQTQIKIGEFFDLPEKAQNKCAAFYLNANAQFNSREHISQIDVNSLLESWRTT